MKEIDLARKAVKYLSNQEFAHIVSNFSSFHNWVNQLGRFTESRTVISAVGFLKEVFYLVFILGNTNLPR